MKDEHFNKITRKDKCFNNLMEILNNFPGEKAPPSNVIAHMNGLRDFLESIHKDGFTTGYKKGFKEGTDSILNSKNIN